MGLSMNKLKPESVAPNIMVIHQFLVFKEINQQTFNLLIKYIYFESLHILLIPPPESIAVDSREMLRRTQVQTYLLRDRLPFKYELFTALQMPSSKIHSPSKWLEFSKQSPQPTIQSC